MKQNKIQTKQIEVTGTSDVIVVNTYLVANLTKAQVKLEAAINKKPEMRWNDEKHDQEQVLDEDGNPKFNYNKVDGKMLDETILPILTELVDSFTEND